MKGTIIEINQEGNYIIKPVSGKMNIGDDCEIEGIGSLAQNAAFHSLLDAFYLWLCSVDQWTFEDCGRIIDLRCGSQKDFREMIKYHYGSGATKYQYIDDIGKRYECKKLEEIPAFITMDNPEKDHRFLRILRINLKTFEERWPEDKRDRIRKGLNELIYQPAVKYISRVWKETSRDRLQPVLKSWADYTKRQRSNTIENLKYLINITKCDDKRVHEIMEGMEKEK